MSDANDIRSILTSKSRVKVAPRDPSLGNKRSTPESKPLVEVDDEIPETEIDTFTTSATSEDLSGLQTELNNLTTVGKRLAVHLEQGIREDLVKLCDSNDITPEILIEAAIALLQEKPNLKSKVLADAKVRLAKRKRAGLVRRTLAMMQKYGGS
ncbi:hypothetical protein COO91_11062 (plasmid) [Nostoc flagelliforme CCNUN1]|uniref:Uncharacterized protein n=1 Tax=Nostoc flagelliforme CCNUN1 TaxID=2038116 RepID=A0A2K8T7U2_9NOSO|nr:hypothetical protein [Nostoc flagelliforme]AUB43720.1 hypothetical protein COO91_09904 [Nostoc flagelliforme CCNUN1]AUB44815.1 hypothetical protein COO91_11062 [Nostoc flagelliforme CCNUN1]